MTKITGAQDMKSCFIFHEWEKWKDTAIGNILSRQDSVVGIIVFQERRCKKCNKLETRSVRSTI